LKSAKTLIGILKAEPSCSEYIDKIDTYLTNVESYLITQAQTKFGQAYVDKWLEQIKKATHKPDKKEEKTRFVPGLAAEHKWIRLTPSKEMPLKKLEALAKESNLEHKIQDDQHLIVMGPDEALKDFVKKLATKYKSHIKKDTGKVHNR
jgi:hypothetical protein